MALTDEATRVVAAAGQLQGPLANLANTRALVVEPMLAALGWDVTNLEHVARDWPLDDGASISYALRLRDGSALFVATSPVNASIDDQALVDETLEHVASADTRWCLLTNGLRYRLFKADDAVAKDDRLMFDVELAEVASNPSSEAANDLSLLTRESLMDGVLEARGEEFYIDPRIQRALLELCRAPSNTFINAMNEAVGDPPVPVRRLRASLGRAVDGSRNSTAKTEAPTLGRPRTSHASARTAAADEGEGSSEPHPAGTASLAAGPAPVGEESAALVAVDSPSIEGVDEITAAPELVDGQAAAIAAELAEPTHDDGLEVATLDAPEQVEDPELIAEIDATEELEEVVASEDGDAAEDVEEVETTEDVEAAEEVESVEAAEDVEAAGSVEQVEATEAGGEAEQVESAESLQVAGEEAVQWKVAPPGRFGRQPEYPLADQFTGKPAGLVELFEGLDRFAHALGGDTARRVRRHNIEYFQGGEVWFAITFMGDAIRVTLTLDTEALEAWHAADPTRDGIASSPLDMLGEIEVTLPDVSRLTDGCELIYAAYARP